MDLKLFNNELLLHGIEIICDNCYAAQIDKKDSNLQKYPTLAEKTTSNLRQKRIRKRNLENSPMIAHKPAKTSKVKTSVKNPKIRPKELIKTSREPILQQTGHNFLAYPDQPARPPNRDLNLNTFRSGLFNDFVDMHRLFDYNFTTPQKIDDVSLERSHKNTNILDSGFKQQLFSTVEPKGVSFDAESLKDFSFDMPDKHGFENVFAFKNLPSPFQSPFVQLRHPVQNSTPHRSLNFDRIPKSLDFLQNPFFGNF